MRTSTILWPEATLGCPLRSSWGATVAGRFASASLNATITTYDADRGEELRTHDCGFLWTHTQFGIFETFHNVTLGYGMRGFMMDFPVAGVMVPTFSHFLDGYRIGDEDGWTSVSFRLASYRRRDREVA